MQIFFLVYRLPFSLLIVFQTHKSDTGFLRSSLFTVSILGVVLRSLPPQKYINILYCDTYGSFFTFTHVLQLEFIVPPGGGGRGLMRSQSPRSLLSPQYRPPWGSMME